MELCFRHVSIPISIARSCFASSGLVYSIHVSTPGPRVDGCCHVPANWRSRTTNTIPPSGHAGNFHREKGGRRPSTTMSSPVSGFVRKSRSRWSVIQRLSGINIGYRGCNVSSTCCHRILDSSHDFPPPLGKFLLFKIAIEEKFNFFQYPKHSLESFKRYSIINGSFVFFRSKFEWIETVQNSNLILDNRTKSRGDPRHGLDP